MKKKGLLVVVALLAMASMMAAMAFTSAKVTSDMSVKLNNTQDALLALVASDYHNAATTDHITADQLNINLSKGLNNGIFGVQPNSEYVWDDLFAVKNNSENPVDVTVTVAPKKGFTAGRNEIFARVNEGNWVKLHNFYDKAPGTLSFELPAGADAVQCIDIMTKSLNGHVEETMFDLVVEATSK